MNIIEKIAKIKQQLPPEARLIAVTKYVDLETIKTIYELGLRDFAESRLQEALEKKEKLKELKDITWHFIGRLQSNKVRQVLLNFDWIHSVDSLELLTRINTIAAQEGVFPKVCLQVKLTEDANKGGFSVKELYASLDELAGMNSLQVKGLMTILPFGLNAESSLKLFKQLAQLKEQINEKQLKNIHLTELSMGMSGDYLQAIEAGATMLRIGRAIFAD